MPIQAYLTENLSYTQSYIIYNYHTSRVTHASLLLQVGLLHVGLLHVGRHYRWRWDNIGPAYLHMAYSKPDTLLLALGQHWPNIYIYLQNKYRKHITLTPWVQNPATYYIELPFSILYLMLFYVRLALALNVLFWLSSL